MADLDVGMAVGLIKALAPKPDSATITAAVDAWLEDNPEATTTVQDGAISYAKLNASLQGTVDDVGDLKTAISYVADGHELIVYGVTQNKALNNKGEIIANNNRILSDFIPVTPGEKIYVMNLSAVSENCAWYSEDSASQSTKVGSVFTVAVGSPTTLTVPANAYYLVLVCHKNTPFGDVYRNVRFIDDSAGAGAISKVWSANKSNAVSTQIDYVSQVANDVGRFVNHEQVVATIEDGFYNSVTGAWTSNASYETINVTVEPGECYLINGRVIATAGMALVIFFDASNNIVSKLYDGSTLSTVFNATNMFVHVPSGVTKMAVLGSGTGDGQYMPSAKKAIIQFAHTSKTGICFGDSTFGNANANIDIPHWLSVKTGNDVKNGAFGGCRMSVQSGYYDAFSMYRLAYAIVNDDWTLQDAALEDTSWEVPSYAAAHLANLKAADWDEVDFITIAYGTNDWRGGNALDNEQNPVDTNTIGGALRYSLNLIMAEYPQIDVYVLSPIWRVVMKDGDTQGHPTGYCDDTPNGLVTGAYYLKDVVDLLKSICEEYHVTFVDNFNIGINKYNWGHWLEDGTHPNNYGRTLMTDNLVKNIKGILH